ncbi:hypothetical protein C5167_018218 [Papaver somniferum]|uniref:GB1/RHD3-type G domain-containing protein n=1 Tax=Papaver somniferum TaxID=3469 RepID=A0A4Y7IQQ0_PAPSO|nr:hypothetical protein C5167_018218 [Papaver somniferum]
MEQMDECCSTQLIDGNGSFNVDGLARFSKAVKLAECRLSYAVVSITGPQSSGKTHTLESFFRTNFREMDAFRGRQFFFILRSQTTKGIWMEKCADIEPCTLVMDLEGTDGRERGEDDTAFEKQSALFALAVSDIVLINMWCHDIGREQAANKPLLKTVFQVMMRLFSPRKTALLFVIRDETRTPLENLEHVLHEDIQKVEVAALNSYEEKEEKFKEQLVQPAHHSVLGRSKTLYDIKDAFDKAMKGDAFAVSVHDCTQSFIAELGKGCAGHITCMKSSQMWLLNKQTGMQSKSETNFNGILKLMLTPSELPNCLEIAGTYEGKPNKALAELVESLLDASSRETWPSIRNLLQCET